MNEAYLYKVPYDDGVILKTRFDLKHIALACRCAAETLSAVTAEVKPGVSSAYLEDVCGAFLARRYGGHELECPDEFPHFISVSVNETAVHGAPDGSRFRGGDLVSIDVALRLDGWYGDCAATVPAGTLAPEKMRLLEWAREATEAGIAAVKPGGRLGDIGAAIEALLDGSGHRIIENLAGHGVGESLHEAPTVLHSGDLGIGDPIVPGMVFTVEPVITAGDPVVVSSPGSRALVTRDGSPTALFEHTIAVTSAGVQRLTAQPD